MKKDISKNARDIKITILIWFTRILILSAFTVLFFIPSGVSTHIDFSTDQEYKAIVISLFLLEIPGLIILTAFHFLLTNLRKNIIFDLRNATLLRIIYICFFVAAVVLMIPSYWKITTLFLAVTAAFGGFSVTVLKGLFNKAVEIKDENDYTV